MAGRIQRTQNHHFAEDAVNRSGWTWAAFHSRCCSLTSSSLQLQLCAYKCRAEQSLPIFGKRHFIFLCVLLLTEWPSLECGGSHPSYRSHARPLLGFACNLLREFDQLQISLVYPSTFGATLEPEIDLRRPEPDLAARLHRCPLKLDQECSEGHLVDYMLAFQERLPALLQKLHVDKQRPSLRYPSLAVVDVRDCCRAQISHEIPFYGADPIGLGDHSCSCLDGLTCAKMSRHRWGPTFSGSRSTSSLARQLDGE